MLMPKRVKFRKPHKPKRSGMAKGGTELAFGEYGIQAMAPAYVTNRQIESARIAMTRYIKRGGKVWINIYPDHPSPRSLPKSAWAPARVRPSGGSPTSSPDASCSSFPVSAKRWPRRPSVWQSTSCL